MNTNLFRRSKASLELLLAAALWGFGFVATVWALQAWAPVPMLIWRFLIAVAIGGTIGFVFAKPTRSDVLWLLKVSFLPALLLTLTLLFQTAGMLYTTATKSGFITCLYIVLVPLLETIVARRKIPLRLWCCMLISLAGIYLIAEPKWDHVNVGDLLTLVCASAAAVQIIILDRVSRKVPNAFLFNVFQTAWATVLILPSVPFQSGDLMVPHPSMIAWAGLIALALGSTLIAFYLQIRAQKILSSTVSSLFFLLESPFALLFAYFFLNEHLNNWQAVGAILILISALMATLRPNKK